MNIKKIISFLLNIYQKIWLESIIIALMIVILGIFFYYIDLYFKFVENTNLMVYLFNIQIDLEKNVLYNFSSTVASTLSTSAVLIFSITMIALMNIASNFSVRYIINTFNNPTIRIILTLFIMTYFYALLFPFINDAELNEPFGQIAYIFILIFICFLSLIYYMQHIVKSIQIDKICSYNYTFIKNKLNELSMLVKEKEYNKSLQTKHYSGKKENLFLEESGYICEINYQNLYNIACENGLFIETHFKLGDFILESTYIFSIKSSKSISKNLQEKILNQVKLSSNEQNINSLEQYMTHLLDIAIKSLSPGINDTNSARIVFENLTKIIREFLKNGDLKDTYYNEKKYKVLKIKTTSLYDIISTSVNSIRFYALKNQPFLCYFVKHLRNTVIFAKNKTEKKLFNDQIDAISEIVKNNNFSTLDKKILNHEIDEYNKLYKKRFKT